MRHFPFERLQNVFIFAEDLIKLEENPAAKIVRCVPRLTEDGPILFRINRLYIYSFITLLLLPSCFNTFLPLYRSVLPQCQVLYCSPPVVLLPLRPFCCPFSHISVPITVPWFAPLYHLFSPWFGPLSHC